MTDAIANKHILIVEDVIDARHLIRATLRLHGFNNIISAAGGQQALKALGKGNIGLIISDWEMPGLDGLDLYEYIQNDNSLNNIPFILLTGHTDKDKVEHALTKGIKNYIAKPFTQETVINKVNEVLK